MIRSQDRGMLQLRFELAGRFVSDYFNVWPARHADRHPTAQQKIVTLTTGWRDATRSR